MIWDRCTVETTCPAVDHLPGCPAAAFTVVGKADRVTGQPATVYTPPEDLAPDSMHRTLDAALDRNSPMGVPDPAEVEALAEWLGAMDEARNVFDLTDEATTVIRIDVDVLAERILTSDWLADHDRTRDRELGERIAAAIEALPSADLIDYGTVVLRAAAAATAAELLLEERDV